MDYTVPAFFDGINIRLPHSLLRFQLFDDVWKLLKAVLVLTAKLHSKNFTNELHKNSLQDEHKQHMESFPWSHRFLTDENHWLTEEIASFVSQSQPAFPWCGPEWSPGRYSSRKLPPAVVFFSRQHHVGSVKGSLFHIKTLIPPTANPEEFSSTGAS